ncbi:RluA family pseudouridine synthase [Paenibacillus sp. CMAA1364]
MKNNRRSGQGQQQSYNKSKSTAPKQERQAPTKHYTVSEQSELLVFLLNTITNIGRNSVKAMLARGQMLVNGHSQTQYNFTLQPGDTVTVSKEKIVEEIPLIGLRIMYEDEDIIVVNKEAGLLSVASSKETELTAYRQLTAYVREKNANHRIFVVHRLDRDTSGVMMFAKNEEVKKKLQDSWEDMVKERTYIALVEGKVKKPEGTITSWLKESSTLRMYSSPYANDGQLATTHYTTIQNNSYFSLLKVHLETGRKNQIRVHMQDIGHPVAHDKKYGAKTRSLGRMGLHAQVLAFEHPTTGETMTFRTEIPKNFLHPFKAQPTP